jgi:transcriptional regulator with XRE-family HTH domain
MKNIDNLIKFGLHIKFLRLERNLTQVELANLAQFDKNYIGQIERGERNPSLINLIRLSKALNVKLTDLTDFEYG